MTAAWTQFGVLYIVLALTGILDSISTIWLLKYTDRREGNAIPKYMHEKFGVKKGESLNFVFWLLIVSTVMAYTLTEITSLEIALIPVAFASGFISRQFLTAYDVRKGVK